MEGLKIWFEKVLTLFYMMLWIFKIDPKKIVFINFGGKGYGGSPKYIAKCFIENNSNYKLYWVCDKNTPIDQFPPNVRIIKRNTFKYFYIFATSKVWISNNRINIFIKKRKEQLYIQTWHGCLALKKIEYDVEEKLSKLYKEVMKYDNQKINFLISNSKFCNEMYRRGFKYNGEILTYGTPRNDILINRDARVDSKVRKFFNLKNEKVLLYVPTFRNEYSKNPYDINCGKLKNYLEESGDNWKIVLRLHPKISNAKELITNFDDYLDGCLYPDIQELISVANIIVTDYSSIMFDGLIANKPVILYAKDVEDYADERGYYFDFNELPFPLAKNNDELMNIIKNNDLNEMKKNYDSFKKKVGLVEEGVASKKVCDLISSYIDGVGNE